MLRARKLLFSVLANKTSFNLIKRSHLLGDLNESLLQKEVTLCGWVSAIRNVSKNLFFLVLRDHSGTIQLTLTRTHVPEETFQNLQEAVTSKQITAEAVIAIKGIVQPRPIGMKNDFMTSGGIEVFVNDYKVLNTLKTVLPFTLNEKYLPAEEVRLQDRVLDLRRPDMQKAIRFRAQINRTIRDFFDKRGFVEIETPILFKSSPEGAKEFLVPRPNGLKYALPQSPQQFKQLLMVSGFDKYYQIARCFRDEGMRADRQPEFTQLDMEMAFTGQDEVMETMESVVKTLWIQSNYRGETQHDLEDKQFKLENTKFEFDREDTPSDSKEIQCDRFDPLLPFQRMTYDNAMKIYGSDKPDLRFGGKIAFSIPSEQNQEILIEGLLLKGKGRSSLNRDASTEFCLPIEGIQSKEVIKMFEKDRDHLWKWHGNNLAHCQEINLISEAEARKISERLEELGLNVGPRDCLLLHKRDANANVGMTLLGRIRLLAMETILKDSLQSDPKFLWVHSFPLLCGATADSLTDNPHRRFDSMHHPFTAPEVPDNFDIFASENPLKLRAQHYDLVLNGQEIGGGSVRIHDAILQERLMRELLGLSTEQINHFSHLIRALKLGAPPHAGMALGLDRIIAILAGKKSIRDVIAFPKNSSGFDLCFKSPS